MEDKPEEPSKELNNHNFWKYAAAVVIVSNLLIVCLLVFAIVSMPTTSKSETENVMKIGALLDNFVDFTNKLNETEYHAQ